MISHSRDDPELARTYDRVSDSQLEGGQRLVERLGLRPGDRVLDVGCGTGRLAEWIAAQGARVVGIDPLPERIALARNRAPGLRFEVGRAEDLGAFADASFDAVCFSAVFHWVEDGARALREAARVLRPGGRVGITTLARELRRLGTVGRVLASLAGPPPGRERATRASAEQPGATLTELVMLLDGARLELLELHVVRRLRRHDTGQDALAFLDASTFGTFLADVPEERRRRLRAELVEAFDARRGPEGVEIEDHAVLAVAERASAPRQGSLQP